MNDTQFEGRFLGVLGGMGPMAGAVFMQRLVALTDSPSDQQHVPAILWNDPRVPDRPAGFAGAGPDPLPWMKNGVSKLVQAGAAALVVAMVGLLMAAGVLSGGSTGEETEPTPNAGAGAVSPTPSRPVI